VISKKPLIFATDAQVATVWVGPRQDLPEGWQAVSETAWVYALAVSFPGLLDEVSLAELKSCWRGACDARLTGKTLFLDETTLSAFESLWGAKSGSLVTVLPADQILAKAWQTPGSLALLPFEALEPRWKVLQIEGLSPWQKGLDLAKYPLVVPFVAAVPSSTADRGTAPLALPAANRDPTRLTVLVMTGVTALVRATSAKMVEKGIDFPGRDIAGWLGEGDLVHISNEASFAENCPKPDPFSTSMRFCSQPEHIALLEHLGVQIVELTGNHLMDWGVEALNLTLDMYAQRGWQTFGGGRNRAASRQAALVEDHGNHLAFLGCNIAGPPQDWAGEDTPGSANCADDYNWLLEQVKELRREGYLPIVDIQYYEDYSTRPVFHMQDDFRKIVDAGAVLVHGTQAHSPKGMEFYQDGFIHYGLGNLFFDQMNVYINDTRIDGTRDEFIDRHIFYDGNYIGTELLTARLEDYARPRPMNAAERENFLRQMFLASGWK
jgi:poly-gamma-glutamate synthesis protein (capsule biosynthesis protein)